MKFAKTLSRDEMRSTMAGSNDYISCSCYDSQGGEHLGDVTCSEDIGPLTCCWAHHDDTNYVDCMGSNPSNPGEN